MLMTWSFFNGFVQSIKRLFDVNMIPCCCLDFAEVDQ